ncbi:uncharacterized protein UDID_01248 [Ustilago sp. UG-2017a]|nr:uncharacterized protein UDID_01248 [Ustilago sp. UG-2017a]
MAPKCMPKLTGLSSSSSASASASSSRGRNANPFGPVDPNSYDDYDEAMQDGVELEEKGERFQFGPKAQRFYDQAGTLYTRAAHLAGANVQQRADALYNASRIHFLLATQFALPPENIQLLVEAIHTSQQAVTLAPSLPAASSSDGVLPNPFTLDTLTQLALSLQTLAESVEELGWPQGLQPPRTSTQNSAQAATPTALWQQALELLQHVADGQNVILQDQETADEAATESDAQPSKLPEGIEAGDEEPAYRSETGDVYGYTSSLVTPSSLMETLLSMLACFTSLIEAATAIEEVQTYSAAIEQIISRAQVVFADSEAPAASLLATSTNSTQASSEVAARWEEIQQSSLTSRVACLVKAANVGVNKTQISSELEAAWEAVNEWGSQLISPTPSPATNAAGRDARVATLCDVGEAGMNLCRLSLRLEPAEARIAAIWALATLSTKLFSQALAALDTSAAGGGSAAVLGQANTSTPTSRARCRILLALSTLSILRSHPAFESAGIAGAIGTRTKLIENARLYARKAITEIGLGWLLRSAPTQVSRSGVVPPPGGWESLSLESEATLHLLRALLYRVNVNGAAVDAGAKAVSEMRTELRNLVQHIVQLRQKPIQVGATPATVSIQLVEWLYLQGAKSFVNNVVDDNGRRVVQEEIAWWEKLFSDEMAVAQ